MYNKIFLERFVTKAKEAYEHAECLNRTFTLTVGEAVQLAKAIEKLLKDQEPVVHCPSCGKQVKWDD